MHSGRVFAQTWVLGKLQCHLVAKERVKEVTQRSSASNRSTLNATNVQQYCSRFRNAELFWHRAETESVLAADTANGSINIH